MVPKKAALNLLKEQRRNRAAQRNTSIRKLNKKLVERMQGGDRKAIDEFVEANSRLITKLALNRGCPVENLGDLKQQIKSKLLSTNAIKSFDPARGRSHSTYFANFFNFVISRQAAVLKARGLRPGLMHSYIPQFEAAAATLRNRGKKPTEKAIAGEIIRYKEKKSGKPLAEETRKMIHRIVRRINNTRFDDISIEWASRRELEGLLQFVVPETQRKIVEEKELAKHLKDGLQMLGRYNPKMPLILKERIINGRPLREVGKDFGIQKERVRQIQDKALRMLKAFLESRGIRGE